MNRFVPEQWVFSLKMLIAVLLAYALSVRMALPQSYWAIATACVVMNPTSGAVRSKSIYRFAGTLCAGAVSLLLLGVVANAPVLLMVCAGLLAMLGFYKGLLDRTPRAYGFQLFGVTMILIATGSVSHPETGFDIALARICEIGVGIASATVIDSLFAPKSLAPVIRSRLNGWLSSMQAWMDDALAGDSSGAPSTYAKHRRNIVDLTAMSALVGQVRYDSAVSEWERCCLFAIQRRLLRMFPMISAIETYSASNPETAKAVSAHWKQVSAEPAHGENEGHLNGRVRNFDELIDNPTMPDQAWHQLIEQNFSVLVADVLLLWSQVRAIHSAMDSPGSLPASQQSQIRKAKPFTLWPDVSGSLRVASGILLGYAVLCTLWWVTGWSEGPTAVIMGTVAIAFFGSADEAGKAIGTFFKFGVMALVLAGVLSYGLLPLAHGFWSFALVMGLVILPLGAWAASNPMAIMLLAVGLSNAGILGVFTPPDFSTFLDSGSAMLIGIYVGSLCIHLVKQMGAAHTTARLERQEREEIAALTLQADKLASETFSQRSIDRIANITSRLPHDDQHGTQKVLSWLRAGIAIGMIRYKYTGLREEVSVAVEALLAEARNELAEPGSSSLLASIDEALARAWQVRGQTPPELIQGLVGLRLALFNNAPSWRPQP